ncbi:hypothetical protein MLD38_038011 [Melastoma candidum]|uniref:Uncharacterized protein n=1 Tax=Melastoma candidum TaxID=119954 RepID=A0ACB9KYJ8_9MYRT|nr:hypothetical protein MLD38_038011 [Melastoma candidum]
MSATYSQNAFEAFAVSVCESMLLNKRRNRHHEDGLPGNQHPNAFYWDNWWFSDDAPLLHPWQEEGLVPSWLETGGWPVMIIPSVISYFHRRTIGWPTTKIVKMKPVFAMTAVIGVLMGLDDYLYAYALAQLPISTSALITSYLDDRCRGSLQCIREATASTVNPIGSTTQAKQAIRHSLLPEVQLVMCLVATLFCTIGTIACGDFQPLPEGARNYSLEEKSSLFSGIVMAAQLQATEILSVIFYRENFQVKKVVSLILSLMGSLSMNDRRM